MKSGRMTGSSLLSEAEAWLYRAGANRQLKPTDPARTAQVILLERQAEEIILGLLNYARGYASEHETLSKLAGKVRDAAIPGNNGAGHKHWSITDELPPGKGGDFRRALNALTKHLDGG
jgi:hypothetical protein